MKSKMIPNRLVKLPRLLSMMPLLTLKTFKMPTTEMPLPLCSWWKTTLLSGHLSWMTKMKVTKTKTT